MTEKKATYQTEAEEALEMLGVGYDQREPAAVIHPPKTVLALGEDGLVDYRVWGWVKTSANFIRHIKKLKGAKLAIWQVLALSIDENGECGLKIKEICRLAGYSHTEVIESLKELEEWGYLSIKKDGKGRLYKPEFVARGINSPAGQVKKLESSDESSPKGRESENDSSLAEGKTIPSIKSLKRVNSLANMPEELDFETMTIDQAYKVPTIALYRKATGFLPGQRLWQYVHDFILENQLTEDQIREAALARLATGTKIENVKFILEWARDGVPEWAQMKSKGVKDENKTGNRKGAGNKRTSRIPIPVEPEYSEEDRIAAAQVRANLQKRESVS